MDMALFNSAWKRLATLACAPTEKSPVKAIANTQNLIVVPHINQLLVKNGWRKQQTSPLELLP